MILFMESKVKNKVWLRLPDTAKDSFERFCAPGEMQSQMEREEQPEAEKEIKQQKCQDWERGNEWKGHTDRDKFTLLSWYVL